MGPSDYDKVTLTAPRHPDLPDGGGYPYSFFVVKEAKFGAVDNYFTFASDYGDVTYYWHGFDYDVNARMANGLVIQGGATTGRGVRDTCEVQAQLPEATLVVAFGAGISQVDACAVDEAWQTNFRGLVSYVIPRVDVQVSAIIRSLANTMPQTDQNAVATNGLSMNANYDVTSRAGAGGHRPAAAGRRRDAGGQPRQAGTGVWPAHQHRGPPRDQGASLRQHQDQRRTRPV